MKIAFARRLRLFTAGCMAMAVVALGCSQLNTVVSYVPGMPKGSNAIDFGKVLSGGLDVFKGLALSEADEPALGQSVALQVVAKYPLVINPDLNEYVTRVGRIVGASSSLPGLKYYFGVLLSEEPNAFSGPHGYIFITTGA